MKHCYGFCAFECISGQCPQTLAQCNGWWYILRAKSGFDMELDMPKSCRDCWYNTGKCEDCVFEGSEQCVYPNKDKNIVIKEAKE